jgi:hypothetical protein
MSVYSFELPTMKLPTPPRKGSDGARSRGERARTSSYRTRNKISERRYELQADKCDLRSQYTARESDLAQKEKEVTRRETATAHTVCKAFNRNRDIQKELTRREVASAEKEQTIAAQEDSVAARVRYQNTLAKEHLRRRPPWMNESRS